MKTRFILLLFTCLAWNLSAQSFLSRSEVGFAFGGMTYLGDLNDQSMFGTPNMAGGLSARVNLDSRWALTLGGSYGNIEGGNPDVIARRNLSFRSVIKEGYLRAEFNFFPYGSRSAAYKRSTPYIFCGLGFFKFNPQALYVDSINGESKWVDLQPLCTEGQGTSAYPERQMYKLFEVCMPFGVGYRWRLSENMHLTMEYGWRKTWTDYLDDVSTTYAGAEVLSASGNSMSAIMADRSGEVVPGYVNAPGIKRGDDSLNDWYSFFNVTLSFSAEMLFGWMRGKSCELK